MANVIKFPYWECEQPKNAHATDSDRDFFKKIAFSEIFQMEVAQIRGRFNIDFGFQEEPESLINASRAILIAPTLKEAIRALGFSYGFSDRWMGTLEGFVEKGEVLLPSKREETFESPWLGEKLYSTEKLTLRVVQDKILGEVGNGVVKPRLLLELEADTTKADLDGAMASILKAQKKYLKRKELRLKVGRSYELLNLIKHERDRGLNNKQLREKILEECLSRLHFTDSDILKMYKEADALGF